MSGGAQQVLAGGVIVGNGADAASTHANRRGPGQRAISGATHTKGPASDAFVHRNLPLAMLDVEIGTTVVRTEHCYVCAEDPLHESTYVARNTWQSECTKHRDPSRQRTSAPYGGWRKP